MGGRAPLLALALVCFFYPAVAAAATEAVRGYARVIDGDTIEIEGQRIRLNGIDAPEVGQTCGLAGGGSWSCAEAAAERLEDLVGNLVIDCRGHGNDRYGRLIATCTAGGTDVGRQLVREGLAWAFVRYDDVYAPEEQAARAAGLAIWRGPAVAPWDYRAGRWEASVESSSSAGSGCPIKGNISRKGERIYHMPWSPWYDRTRIDEAAGERWFCDEAEAQAAGWRAAMSSRGSGTSR